MRTVSMEKLQEQFPPLTPDPEDGSYLDHAAVQMADWKDRPDEILKLVDKQLRAFDLAMLMFGLLHHLKPQQFILDFARQLRPML